MKQPALVMVCASLLAMNAAIAANRCDIVPDTPEMRPRNVAAQSYPAQCNATGTQPPALVRSGTGLGAGVLEFVDQWQGECELKVGGQRTGQFKFPTACPPGATKTAVGGVWTCFVPATVAYDPVIGSSLRDQCRRDLFVRVERVNERNMQGPGSRPFELMAMPADPRQITTPWGFQLLKLEGLDVAAAENVTVASIPTQNPARANLTLAARLPPPSSSCFAPNCQWLEIAPPRADQIGFYTVTLLPRAPSRAGTFLLQVIQYVPPESTGRVGPLQSESRSTTGAQPPSQGVVIRH